MQPMLTSFKYFWTFVFLCFLWFSKAFTHLTLVMLHRWQISMVQNFRCCMSYMRNMYPQWSEDRRSGDTWLSRQSLPTQTIHRTRRCCNIWIWGNLYVLLIMEKIMASSLFFYLIISWDQVKSCAVCILIRITVIPCSAFRRWFCI